MAGAKKSIMNKTKVLALILAGGKGGRLGALTENRAKPVMPFLGSYRLIDFALSNCCHSQISDVWIIEQYQLHSLNEHLANGRPWDLDRTYGGMRILPPNQIKDRDDASGFAQGNADAIFRHRDAIRAFAPDVLLVLSADHIYKLDFRDVIAAHLERGAEVTMVTTKVPKDESASRFGVVRVGDDQKIIDFAYKPERPASDLITTEVFVYDAARLFATLDELAAMNESLADFGDKLIPKMVERGGAFEYRFKDYWLDVGTIAAYYRAQMEFLNEEIRFAPDDSRWAILTVGAQRAGARIGKSALVENSLVSNGCRIAGRVVNSILAAGVVVEETAEIIDSIVLPDARIHVGARIEKAIVDSNSEINRESVGELDEPSGVTIFARKKVDSINSDGENVRLTND